MPREHGERADDWLARAVDAYFRAGTGATAPTDDRCDQPDERSAAFSDWYEAAKAVLAERFH